MIAASHEHNELSGKNHAVLAACLSCLVMIIILLSPRIFASFTEVQSNVDDQLPNYGYSNLANSNSSSSLSMEGLQN